ncbi:4Fe-4S dicluster domain-containing protein [bacterium]|nr:4Fe-4S dicluster domain-containing protein [bacterium]
MADFHRGFDLLECVSCGLCLEVCPTYDILRDEGSGPRGRILLMGRLASAGSPGEWTHHLDECVGCLACEARCPAGVPYSGMLDHAHESLRARRPERGLAGRMERWALDEMLSDKNRLDRLFRNLRYMQRLGIFALAKMLRLHRLPGLDFLRGLRWMPRLNAPRKAPTARPKAAYYYFRGCVGPHLFAGEDQAARRLLDRLGGYREAKEETCCGAIHRHRGDLEGSRELAKRNIEAFAGEEEVVTTSAGCGAAMKEYGNWLADDPAWAERAREFSQRVRDLSEVMDAKILSTRPCSDPMLYSYEDACHAVHAQGISERPREILDGLATIQRVEMPHADRCCGAGGTWFLDQPELSETMIRSKVEELVASGAEMLVVANPGCRMQWERVLREAGVSAKVAHPAEIWAEHLD